MFTVLAEAATLYLRFRSEITATEFNQTAPLLLQIHHMFWSVPLLVVVWLVWRNVRLSGALLGIALGFGPQRSPAPLCSASLDRGNTAGTGRDGLSPGNSLSLGGIDNAGNRKEDQPDLRPLLAKEGRAFRTTSSSYPHPTL